MALFSSVSWFVFICSSVNSPVFHANSPASLPLMISFYLVSSLFFLFQRVLQTFFNSKFYMKIFIELLGEEGMYKTERLFDAFSCYMYVCL